MSISKLANGIRIASHPTQDHFMTLSIFIDCGSKYELAASRGFTHILDRMAFKSNASYDTTSIVNQIELLGGNVLAQSGREHIMYQAAIFNKDLEKTIQLLSSIVKSPLLLPEEVKSVCESCHFELDDQLHNMEAFMPGLLHNTAYRDINGQPATYGNSTLASLEALSNTTSDQLRQFRDTWFTPDRIVVAGVGMDHQLLVEYVEKYFSDMPTTTPLQYKTQLQQSPPIQYTGGIKVINSKNLPQSPNPDDYPFTQVQVAFESMDMKDPDIYALATLSSLLGGGGSFSAGGPGKGMYTRLYTDVLNRYHWIESANKIHHSYFLTGLFGISAAVPPIKEAHDAILPIICDQLLQATATISKSDLSRAKNQLKSNLLMSLESKLTAVEDLGKQVLLKGSYADASDVVKKIDLMEPKDLMRAARRVILGSDEQSTLNFQGKHWARTGKGEPTVVIRGHLFKNDPLEKAEKCLSDWGVGKQIKKGRWF